MSIYADKKLLTPEEIGRFEAESYFLAGNLNQDLLASVIAQSIRAYENDAATRMRDRCVDAIKTLRATPHGAAYNNAINDAIHKVESLTLEQGEQEKSK